MTANTFAWDNLATYKKERRFLDGAPTDRRTFWAPHDSIHQLLVDLLNSSQHSIVLNMFGYDDDELDSIIRMKIVDPSVYVQMNLDRSQSSGVHERGLLKKWENTRIGTSIAIGTSVNHAISHLKVLIVDGIYTVKGSTNWSISGEEKQDNELTISKNPVEAIEARKVLDINHDFMLMQMKARTKR